MKKYQYILLITLCAFLFTGCSNNKDTTVNQSATDIAKKVTIATIGDSSVMMDWVNEIVDPKICEIEVMSFTENQLPAMSLKDNQVDAFIANQIIWLEAFNDGNNCDLTMLEPYIYYPGYGAYSIKYDSISDIPENAQVAIPGDPSNMERALLILEGMDLIKLGSKTDEFYNLLDIEENFKNLNLIETELTTTAGSIQDVDFVICTATSIMKSGYDPIKDSLYDDPAADKFSIGLVVQPKDKDAEWAKEIIRAMQTDEWKQQFNDYFKGSRVLY